MATHRLFIAALAVSLAACGSSGTTSNPPDDPVGDTEAEGVARGDALADHASAELSGDDYLVVIGKTASILAALNNGEIDQASFGAQIVGDADIIDFASQLIVDHEDANVELDAVVRGYGVAYLPSSAADALAGELNSGLADLRATPPAHVDFTFVEMQVINHAEAQVLLDELAVQVGDGAMGDYIATTRSMIDVHLADSEDLLARFY